MKIKITRNIVGVLANSEGSQTKMYALGGMVFTAMADWEKKLAMQFMEASVHEEIKTVGANRNKKRSRARTKSGHFKSDDP